LHQEGNSAHNIMFVTRKARNDSGQHDVIDHHWDCTDGRLRFIYVGVIGRQKENRRR